MTTRTRSLYALAGEEGRRERQRALLLRTLREHAWNLTGAAEALGMAGSPAVIRALRDVAPGEYAAAKAAGKVSQGNRRA